MSERKCSTGDLRTMMASMLQNIPTPQKLKFQLRKKRDFWNSHFELYHIQDCLIH